MDDVAKRVLSILERQCTRRECCSSDIYRKALEKLEGDSAAAGEVLKSLLENKFVDDLRYASAFARDKAVLGGWGSYKIRQALIQKRIDGHVIDEALETIDMDKASARLERLLENKWKSLGGDPQAKLKLMKYALSRGYDYDDIRRFSDGI